jgi:hypothetical protein
MEPLSGSFEPSEEVDDMQWVPTGIAGRVLSYEHDRLLLDNAVGPVLEDQLVAARA